MKLDKDIEERAIAYRKVCESVNYIWPNKDFVMVCARPTKILRDESGKLHSETRKALEYPDGWWLYIIHGVRFDEELWRKIAYGKITAQEVLGLKNAEQRMVAMKVRGMENFLKELNAKLVDKSERGNELYLVQKVFSQPDAYFVRLTCPSTGRVYMEGIDPEFAKENPRADACVAWQLGMGELEYAGLTVES